MISPLQPASAVQLTQFGMNKANPVLLPISTAVLGVKLPTIKTTFRDEMTNNQYLMMS